QADQRFGDVRRSAGHTHRGDQDQRGDDHRDLTIGRFARTGTTGKLNEKAAPSPPGPSSTHAVPPIVSTERRTMNSPKPTPCSGRVRWSPSRVNRSKMRSRSAIGTPGPRSTTVVTTR